MTIFSFEKDSILDRHNKTNHTVYSNMTHCNELIFDYNTELNYSTVSFDNPIQSHLLGQVDPGIVFRGQNHLDAICIAVSLEYYYKYSRRRKDCPYEHLHISDHLQGLSKDTHSLF